VFYKILSKKFVLSVFLLLIVNYFGQNQYIKTQSNLGRFI